MVHDDTAQLSTGQAVAARTRIVLRPFGSPLPLGLLALAPAGLLLSCLQIGAFSPTKAKTVALIVLVFAGAWLASGTVLLDSQPGATSPAFGVFLLAISTTMIVLVASAAGGKAGPAVVMAAGSARFLLAGLYELTSSIGVEHAAAIVGFVLAATAIYTSLATLLEDIHGAGKLPTGRRNRAATAIRGGMADQLAGLEHEAGVRQQL